MAEPQEYQVTARKWRPAEFASVVGQEHVTQTLKNAIKQGRLHHAYLFSGPRGVGKTTTARILAKALNCTNPGPDLEPCNQCDSCRAITEGRSMDVVEIDGASNNSVEDVRKLRDNAKYPPVIGHYKLYIIDEVHMLSTSAFNALLKTLEEPPKHLVFVFATTEPHKVPATILSRCQRFDFRRMQIEDIVSRLAYIAQQEGMEVEEDALVVIAKKGDGSMRDSQSIFDQVTSFCGMKITYAQANEALNVIDQGFFFRVTDMMRSGDVAEAFAIVEQIMRDGYDIQEFLIGLAEHLRNYLTTITTGSTRLIETARVYLDRYESEARTMEQGDLIRALHLTLAAQQAIRTSSQPRLRIELALVQLAVMDSTVSLTQLLEKIDRIPEGGAAPPSTSPAAAPPRASAPVSVHPSAPEQSPAPPAEQGKSYAAVLKEQHEGKGEEKKSSVKDLASFPTSAPVPATSDRTPIYTADHDSGSRSYPSASAPASIVAEAPLPGAAINGDPSFKLPTSIEVQRQWQSFLDYCSDKKMLATALGMVQPPEVYGSTLRLYISNETDMTIIARSKEVLVEKLQSFFKAPLTIESVVGAGPRPNVVDPQPKLNGAPLNTDHPFLRGLIDLLEANPI